MSKKQTIKQVPEAQDFVDSVAKRVEQRVVLMNSLALCLDLLVDDIDEALTAVTQFNNIMRFGMKGDEKKLFSLFTSRLKEAANLYDKFIKSRLEGTTGGDHCKWEGYRADANEIIRIIMLYIDRIGTEEGAADLERQLREIPEGEFFPNSVVDRFNFKARK